MTEIFLSYSHDNDTVVRRLAGDLAVLGHEVWFDRPPTGGQAWWDQIIDQILRCGVFVFALTPEGLNSTACQREFAYAGDLGKPVLPILLTESVSPSALPSSLLKIPYVDYRKDDRRTGLQLASILMMLPAAKRLPEPLPPAPEAPISQLGIIEEEIQLTSSLSFERQCVLLVGLRRSLKDNANAHAVRVLLQRLRQRTDLSEQIVEEIDDMLAKETFVSSQSSVVAGQTSVSVLKEQETPAESKLYWPPETPVEQKKVQPARWENLLQPRKKEADGVFVDPKTNLMWTVKDNGCNITWLEANDYAMNLSLGGYSDWRLPTIKEVESLCSRNGSEIRIKRPIELTRRFVWSSAKDGGGSAWYFDFSYGSKKSCCALLKR